MKSFFHILILKSLKTRHRFFLFLFSLLFAFNSYAKFGEDTLLIINNRAISKAEFLYHFQKNNGERSKENVKEYLDLYINFQLKLSNALEKNISQNIAFINELAEYRLQLSEPYLKDIEKEEEFAREAYERLHFEINASHILIKLEPEDGPEDTLKAYELAIKIGNRIRGGEEFDQINLEEFNNPRISRNSGNFDYFTAFQTDYAFETAAYNMIPGEISMPVRSSKGYHIIQLNEKRKVLGEVKTAHIMVDFQSFNSTEADARIRHIGDLLKSGTGFENLVLEYSTDSATVKSGGELPWISSKSSLPEIWNTAASLSEIGDISEPVKTKYGWHIIKLLDRRLLPPYIEMEEEIKTLIREADDERKQIIENSFTERLKQEWDFKEYPDALEMVCKLADESVTRGNWTPPASQKFDETLILIDGKKITQTGFINFMTDLSPSKNLLPKREFINAAYQKFVAARLLSYENYKLDEKYPEFRFQYQEYRDAMLLLGITKNEVWQRVDYDKEGLKSFYEDNRDNYLLPERLSAKIFTTDSKYEAKSAAKIISRFSKRDHNEDNQSANQIGDENIRYFIGTENGVYRRGDNEIIDQIKWKRGVSEIIYLNGKYHFALVDELLPLKKLSMEEAANELRFDYQEYLMSNWIEDLRTKYKVQINEEVLKSIQ